MTQTGIAFIPGIVALIIATGVALVAGRRAVAAPGPARPTAGQRSVLWRPAGVVAGLLAAGALTFGPSAFGDLGVALATPTFALSVLAGVLVTHARRTSPASAVRTAVLEIRTARSFLPGGLVWATLLATVGLAALLTLTSHFGDVDAITDGGRLGSTFTVPCAGDSSESAHYWPGLYYSVPIGVSVLAGLALAGVVARVVARRPRPTPDTAAWDADDRARRASGRTVIAACGVLVAAPLAGAAVMAGAPLARMTCVTPAQHLLGWVCLAVALVAGLGTCWFLVNVLLPVTRSSR